MLSFFLSKAMSVKTVDLMYYNKDSNKGAGGYVPNQNREKKYKFVEKVYKLICDKRSKRENP